MTAIEVPTSSTTFRGAPFAVAWRSVALGWSKDKARPVLDHTIAVEVFEHGVRLVSTDSYVLLHTWVGADEYTGEAPPISERPISTVVAQDSYGRSIGLMAHVINIASDENAPRVDVVLGVGVMDDDPFVLAGMARPCVTLAVADQELLRLPLVESDFPDWRALLDGFTPVMTDAIALQPKLVARLAKLGDFHDNQPLRWQWGGPEGMALIDVVGSDPFVSGLVMPVRIVEGEA